MIDLIDRHRAALTELCQRHQVRQLELFGSATGHSFKAGQSDLDFLVDFQPLPPSRHSRAYFGLWFDLEDLFGRRVDLVETAAATNPYFLSSIRSSRQVLYAA